MYTKRWSWYTQSGVAYLWNSVGSVRMAIAETAATYQIYGTWANISDRRVKQDITEDTIELDDLMHLRPVSYRLISDVANDPRAPYRHGFIAQEVAKIGGHLADLVSVWHDPTTNQRLLGIDYTGLIAPLVGAVQELARRIAALENAHVSNSDRRIVSGDDRAGG